MPVCAEFVPSTPVFGSVVEMNVADLNESSIAAATELLLCGNCTRDLVNSSWYPPHLTFLVLSLERFATPVVCIEPCLNVTVLANLPVVYNASVSRQDVASQLLSHSEGGGERQLSKTDIAAIVGVGGGSLFVIAGGFAARWYRNRKLLRDAEDVGHNPFNN
jgi:hypothetical protein